MNTRSAILGIGHYVPTKVVTNQDLAKMMTTSDEWIVQRTGIKERRYIEHDGIGASDLAVPAVKMALEHAKLETKDLVVGTGTVAAAGDTVGVKYVSVNYANGKDFTDEWTSGKPTSFPLSGVIPGFAQGIEGMKVGGRREIVIPWTLGYGAKGQGPIGPKETLVFVVDLKSVSAS